MEQSFFKKRDPRIAVGLNDGRRIRFHDIGFINGAHLGLLSTHEDVVKNSLRSLIQQGKGGIDEISYDEYMDLKKKRNSSPQPFREEIRNSDVQRQRSILAAQKESAKPAAADEQAPEPPTAPLPDEQRPKPRVQAPQTADAPAPPPKNRRSPKNNPPPPPPSK